MCGIAGVAGRSADLVSDEVLGRIAHRGPDGSGRFVSQSGSVTLWHTRLAIQDLSSDGAQPMQAANGQVTVVFNGEIYNFRELRADLQRRGYAFHSHSDTEVLLALYLQEGPDLLAKLNGIYAFAIWDARSSSLFLARDGFGVKPLYFSQAGGAFAFASEIKALICLPWIRHDPDVQAFAYYVRYLWCPGTRTPLCDVSKLEPGEALIVRDGRIARQWKHYRLPVAEDGGDSSRSVSDWVEEVRSTLSAAVERQMVSDVPVGAFLSGGLDSSAVVAYARKHATGRLQCFTIDFDPRAQQHEGFVRDLPYAERVARHLDVDLHVVHVGAGIADELPRMVWHLDEPQADLSAFNVLLISELARKQGIKVLLSGTGADDLFTGYRRHRALALDAFWSRVPRPLRTAIGSMSAYLPGRPPFLRRLSRLMSAAASDGDARLVSYFEWSSVESVRSLFVPEFQSRLGDDPLRDTLRSIPEGVTQLQRMLLLEQRYFLADHNLNYMDKMSMAVGVESRVPFLDLHLAALAARIPDQYRQHGAEGKWILKTAMQGILPDDVIWRPKTGFGVPLRAWLRSELRPLLHDLLGPQSVRSRGLFDPAAVTQMVNDNQAGRADYAYSLLSLMCIELWCRQFLEGAASRYSGAAA